MYYIKKIKLISNDDVISEVSFKAGLNIVHGESNTGKSLIVDCINYMSGATKHRFDEKLNIKVIEMTISVDDKDIDLTREIGSNEVYVDSKFFGIKSGTYNIKKGKPTLSELWLKLMGIDEEVHIIRTMEGGTQRLTYRTFSHIFLIDEDRVFNQESVLASKNSFGGSVSTSVLSSLLYLATEKNYMPEQSKKNKTIRKERKEAVRRFFDRSIEKIGNQKFTEFSKVSEKSPAELEQSISLLLNDIGSMEGILDDKNQQANAISEKILQVDNKISECKVLFNRNKNLATQYASDIKRLTFIAEGDIHSNDLPKLDHCPFCNGELNKEQSQSCVDASISEVKKIEYQINDLKSMQESLLSEMDELNIERNCFIKERQEIEISIRRELMPKINELRDELTEYMVALNQCIEKEMVDRFSEVLLKELKVTEEEESENVKIEIPQKFKDIFLEKLENELGDLLVECRYRNYSNSRFKIPGYDIVINGQDKKSQGKGYRAYLNTLVAIAIQNCLFDYKLHLPRILVVDSPILTLKEKEDDPQAEYVTDTMKIGLFTYFVNHQDDRQYIVIENNIPGIDYKDSNLIEFTKDENNGRYGLLANFYN